MSSAMTLAIMMAPVSVCHQLSWIGRPNASIPQRTASGLSGSPTLAMKRSAGSGWSTGRRRRPPASSCVPRSAPCTTRSPPRRARTSYQRSASKSPSSTTLVTPSASGAMIPYDVPVTQPGSAVHQNTSSSWRSSANRAVASWATTAWWTWMAAFGAAGRATREMQQRHVARVSRADVVGGRRVGHQLGQLEGAVRSAPGDGAQRDRRVCQRRGGRRTRGRCSVPVHRAVRPGSSPPPAR